MTTIKNYGPNTKTYKVLTFLQEGESISPAAAQHRFGVGNLRAEATRLRQAGYVVQRSRRMAGNHVAVTEYSLGKPNRELIALGYLARARGLAQAA
jgi:hypothetical protein